VFEAVEFASEGAVLSGRFYQSVGSPGAAPVIAVAHGFLGHDHYDVGPVCRGVRERGSGRLALRPSQLRRQSAAEASEPTLVDSLRSA
jgi:hypothetical protein